MEPTHDGDVDHEYYFDEAQQMVSRHRRAYEEKFVQHGLRVLFSGTFNHQIMENTTTADPCYVWIVGTASEMQEETDQLISEYEELTAFEFDTYKREVGLGAL